MQATTPISELLGSTPEETQQLREQTKVHSPAFRGVGLFSKQKFEYVPMDESEFSYTVGDKVFQQKCNECYMFAEHKQVMTAVDLNGDEFNPDPNYKRFLCTVCRDKYNQPKKKKEVRERKYVRYATYNSRKPSMTAAEMDEMQKRIEDERIARTADGQSEGSVTGSPSDAPANDSANNQAS